MKPLGRGKSTGFTLSALRCESGRSLGFAHRIG